MKTSEEKTKAEVEGNETVDPYLRLLSKREMGSFLGKSESSIDRLRKRRIIPYILVGGEIRFRLRDVEKALERYTVKEVCL